MSAAEISTFVFLDLETTGLPWQERNQTKIIELSVVAISRADILRADREIPAVKKLTILLNPGREINPYVTKLTGLSQDALKSCPRFEEQYESFKKFLKPLPRPLCIVAHNGNQFDYKILRAEVKDARRRLPSDLLCVDSLVAFRQIDSYVATPILLDTTNISSLSRPGEDEWPDLDISTENWDEIDEICERLSDVSTDPDSPIKAVPPKKTKTVTKPNVNKKILHEVPKPKVNIQDKPTEKKPFSLSALYTRLLNKEPMNAHRAESDCLMLLECVLATKHKFLPWADNNCKLLSKIQPLARNKQAYNRRY